jgi:hypothetical protein
MNKRVVFTGAAMVVLAAAFFVWMLTYLAPKSTNPAEMMKTVGQVAGAVGGIGIVMILFGLFRRR